MWDQSFFLSQSLQEENVVPGLGKQHPSNLNDLGLFPAVVMHSLFKLSCFENPQTAAVLSRRTTSIVSLAHKSSWSFWSSCIVFFFYLIAILHFLLSEVVSHLQNKKVLWWLVQFTFMVIMHCLSQLISVKIKVNMWPIKFILHNYITVHS